MYSLRVSASHLKIWLPVYTKYQIFGNKTPIFVSFSKFLGSGCVVLMTLKPITLLYKNFKMAAMYMPYLKHIGQLTTPDVVLVVFCAFNCI